MAEKIPSWIERLLLPQLSEIKGEIKAFRGQTEGELKAINTRINSLEGRISDMDKRLTSEITGIRESLNVA